MRKLFRRIKESRKSKDFLVFLVFVCIAAVFWFILALNDDVQNMYDVPLKIEDVPDSVTFISDPPSKVRVTVRDRGLNMVRYKVSGVPALNFRFSEYADGGAFNVSHNGMQAALRRILGASASLSSVTPDSLSLVYTTYPGQRIPLQLDYDVTVAPGMVLGTPKISSPVVDVYSTSKSDTLRRLYTERVVLRDIDRNTTVVVPLKRIPGKRLVPSEVNVTFPVEQLVKKESEIPVDVDNIPIGHDILFFPSRVKVSYYVPMSRYADTTVPVKVEASFNEALHSTTDKVGIRIVSKAPYLSNVELLQDSVEYTVVKSN